MEEIKVRKEDQILMNLVHYFVTEKNYTPIYVRGVKDEIWLENIDEDYRVIRINSNSIINQEQFEFDQYKIMDIIKQIKKKTYSFKVRVLNINLNEDEDIKKEDKKNIKNIVVKNFYDLENNEVLKENYPDMKDKLYPKDMGIDFVYSVTRDINAKTEEDNKRFNKIFTEKMPLITLLIVIINVIMYFISLIFPNLVNSLYISKYYLLHGEVYRLLTYGFLHGGVVHLFCNMYSLYVIGREIESKYGKWRFLIIYFGSMIGAGLLSSVFGNSSIGASGAIFGLLSSLLFFSNRFRLFFGDALKKQIVPVILVNLLISVLIPGIDLAGHVGGLIIGYLLSMAVSIPNDTGKKETVNGIILTLIFIGFLIYLLIFN